MRPGRKVPGLSGSATLIGTAPGDEGPTPWRVAGPMTVDLDRATIDKAEFRLGPEERALTADGAATLTFGSPPRLSDRGESQTGQC